MRKKFEIEIEVEVDDTDFPVPADGDWCLALEEAISEAILSGVDLSIENIYIYETFEGK